MVAVHGGAQGGTDLMISADSLFTTVLVFLSKRMGTVGLVNTAFVFS